MGPPEDVAPRDLFAILSASRLPNEIVDYPRKGGDGKPLFQLRLQALTSGQHDEARFKAQDRLKKKGGRIDDLPKSALLQETLGDAVARELLAMACLDTKPIAGTENDPYPQYARVFIEAEHMERYCSSDEIAILFNQYLLLQHKYGPLESTVDTKEDVDAWISRLAEGGASHPLGAFSYPSLAELCLSLAQRVDGLSKTLRSQWSSLPPSLVADLESLITDTSSSGEPAGTSTESEIETEPTPENAAELGKMLRQKPDRPG